LDYAHLRHLPESTQISPVSRRPAAAWTRWSAGPAARIPCDYAIDQGEARTVRTGKRTKRIIAIFGGSGTKYPEVLKAAEDLGQEIAGQRQILLTGGIRKDEGDERSAKGRAIKGAGSEPWVGVERKQSGAKLADQLEQHFCMISDLNHLRNYLEANMCDAAIGLAGDEGTKSEVTSALALGRPVAFVGDYWKSQRTTKYDLEEDPSHWLRYLYETTRDKFRESGGSKALVDGRSERACSSGALRILRLRGHSKRCGWLDPVRIAGWRTLQRTLQ
jgi:predicted Rossmann-fold nucleotide-binding protein